MPALRTAALALLPALLALGASARAAPRAACTAPALSSIAQVCQLDALGGTCACPPNDAGAPGVLTCVYSGYQCAYPGGACQWDDSGRLQNTAQTNCQTFAPCVGACACPADKNGESGVLINQFTGYQCAYGGNSSVELCTWDNTGALVTAGCAQAGCTSNCPASAPCAAPTSVPTVSLPTTLPTSVSVPTSVPTTVSVSVPTTVSVPSVSVPTTVSVSVPSISVPTISVSVPTVSISGTATTLTVSGTATTLTAAPPTVTVTVSVPSISASVPSSVSVSVPTLSTPTLSIPSISIPSTLSAPSHTSTSHTGASTSKTPCPSATEPSAPATFTVTLGGLL